VNIITASSACTARLNNYIPHAARQKKRGSDGDSVLLRTWIEFWQSPGETLFTVQQNMHGGFLRGGEMGFMQSRSNGLVHRRGTAFAYILCSKWSFYLEMHAQPHLFCLNSKTARVLSHWNLVLRAASSCQKIWSPKANRNKFYCTIKSGAQMCLIDVIYFIQPLKFATPTINSGNLASLRYCFRRFQVFDKILGG
jgi:hypothetical protein